MADLAAFVLAAGSGSRLRPLTEIRPKALCPVGNVPLVDIALDRVGSLTDDISVNVWHHSDQMVTHLGDRVRLVVEAPTLLGTAGAIGAGRDWIDGRPLLVHNADAWHHADMETFHDEWDGERVRLLVTDDPRRGDFGNWRFCGVSLMPWHEVQRFEPVPSHLWDVSWERLHRENQLDFVAYDGPYFDCGTPRSYLSANMAASGGANVVADDAHVVGHIDRCVVWPGATVAAHEHLVEAIRASGGITVDATADAVKNR